MKLWELRSYEQVIKLEQDRLIYQARLQARFGRNWRRKAPNESLMPLRLAKYGVPLAETAPSGLHAAGIEVPPEIVPAPRAPELVAPEQPKVLQQPIHDHAPAAAEHSRMTDALPDTAESATAPGHPTGAFDAFAPAPRRSVALAPERRTVSMVIDQGAPTPIEAAANEQGHDPGLSGVDLTKTHDTLPPEREADAGQEQSTALVLEPEPTPDPEPAPVPEPQPEPAAEAQPTPGPDAGPVEPLTTVDRYYLAWTEYIQEYGHEPRDAALSQHLAGNGMTGRNGAPVSPSTLRRYLPPFRIYSAWAQHLDDQGTAPTPDELSNTLASRGITGAPYTTQKIAPLLADFPRRRAALDADSDARRNSLSSVPR
ncbi:hypothetical protein [Streptomyces sp. NPDC102282]|uniref:hypothetical protein n=1 Tax=Streptomyces sp. NPDC102282 TaxID=3366154 RepID=UPI00380D44C6